jgi:hypothetical protein
MTYVGKIEFQSIRVPFYFHLALLDHIFLIGAIFTQRLEVTIPGVNKSGIACEKIFFTVRYTYNNPRIFQLKLMAVFT